MHLKRLQKFEFFADHVSCFLWFNIINTFGLNFLESVLLVSGQVPDDQDDDDNDDDGYDHEGDGDDNCNDDGQMLSCTDSNDKSRAVEDDQGSILRGKTGAPFGIWK